VHVSGKRVPRLLRREGCWRPSRFRGRRRPHPMTARSSLRHPTSAGAPTPPWPGPELLAGCGCLPGWTTPPPRPGPMWQGRRPLRRPPAGLRRRHRPLGRLEADVARGLALRHDWDPSTARPTSPAPWPGWASATTRRSWVNPRPTAAPNPGSAPSRSSACGSSCTTPSRSSARPWPASSSATTAPGSSNGTATRLRRRPIRQLKRQQRHDQVGTTSVQETGRCSGLGLFLKPAGRRRVPMGWRAAGVRGWRVGGRARRWRTPGAAAA
jgi:hypothetical protein